MHYMIFHNYMIFLSLYRGQMVVPYRMIHPWLLLDWIYNMTSVGRKEKKQKEDLSAACRNLIKERREARQRNCNENNEQDANDHMIKKSSSLLEYMIEASEKNGDCFNDEDIINECCTFMLAGQDSVGTATAMTLFMLATHPDWQEKCINELDEIFENGDERSPTMQDLNAMRILECCISEAMRLYPSVPLFARTLGEDLQLGNNYESNSDKIVSYIFFFLLQENK